MAYRVFVRNWWRWEHSASPGSPRIKVPNPGARKYTLKNGVETEDEARCICKVYNDTHKPGPLSRKAEYTRW